MATNPQQATDPGKDRMNRALWTIQLFLALIFGITGVMKLVLSIEGLTEMMIWPGLIPSILVRISGAAEVLGALGLILPGLTGIKPWLTCYAGYGLMTIMIMAMGFHMSHSGWYMIFPNLVLGGLALYVALGRSEDRCPIPERGRSITV